MININEVRRKRLIMAKKRAKKRALKRKIEKAFMIGVVIIPIIMMGKAGLLNDTPVQHKIPDGAQSWGFIQENGIDRYEVFYENGRKFKLDLHTGAHIPMQINDN